VVVDPFLGSGFIELYQRRRSVERERGDEMAAYFSGLGDDAPFNSIEEWEALSGRPFRRGGGGDRRGGQALDSLRVRRDSLRSRGDSMEPRPGADSEAPSFQEWRTEIQELFRRVLEDHDLNGLFFPQAGAPVPDLVEDPDRPDYNPNNHPELPSNIVNDIGLPVVTVPFGYYEDGTPFVLAFIGDVWTEPELLAFAYDLEQATRARVPPHLRKR
jgi:hypothetical protein